MTLLAPSATSTAHSETRRDSSPLFTVRLLQAIARLVEAHDWMVFVAVCLVCGWLRLSAFPSRHLDHDELYTFYIAQAPTIKQLLVLARTVDLHPPLSYLLIRASFAIFGVSTWSCRLPSVLAFLCTAALLFWLVRRILSPLYGIISILFLWSVPLTYQADEARPYSLLLCFSTLMLVSWYLATEDSDFNSISRRRLALLTFTVSGFGLLLSHVLGVLPYAAFLVAELVRWSIRRNSDWELWTALSAPAISCLTYVPLIHTHSAILFTDEYRATPIRIFGFYCWSIRFLAIPLVSVAVFALLWPSLREKISHHRRIPLLPSPAALRPLGFLLCALWLVPLGVGIVFARTGSAFFDRYGVVILIPIAVIPALVLGFRTQRNEMAGVVVALALSAVLFLNTSGKSWLIEQLSNVAPPTVARYVLNALALPVILTEHVRPRVPAHLQRAFDAAPALSNLDTIDPNQPLVANSGLTFLEIDREGDTELAKRLYLLNDRQAASAIAHDTVFEDYQRLKAVFPIRGNVRPYCAFVIDHPRFLVLGAYNHPQGWLLRKLETDGADLQIIGTYANTLEEHDLYEVTVPANLCHSPQ